MLISSSIFDTNLKFQKFKFKFFQIAVLAAVLTCFFKTVNASTYVMGTTTTVAFSNCLFNGGWPAGLAAMAFTELLKEQVNTHNLLGPNMQLHLEYYDEGCSENPGVPNFYKTILFQGTDFIEQDVRVINEKLWGETSFDIQNDPDWTIRNELPSIASTTDEIATVQTLRNLNLLKSKKRVDFPDGIQAWIGCCSTAGLILAPVFQNKGIGIPTIGYGWAGANWLDRSKYGQTHSSYPADDLTYGGAFKAFPKIMKKIAAAGGQSQQNVFFTNVVFEQSAGVGAPQFFMESGFSDYVTGWDNIMEASGPDISTSLGVTTKPQNAKGFMIYQNSVGGRKEWEQVADVAIQIKRGFKSGKAPKLIAIWAWSSTPHVAAMVCQLWKAGVRNVYYTIVSWIGGFTGRSVISATIEGDTWADTHGCTYEQQQAAGAYLIRSDALFSPQKNSGLTMSCAPDYDPWTFMYEAYRRAVTMPTGSTYTGVKPSSAAWHHDSTLDEIETAVSTGAYWLKTGFGWEIDQDASVIINSLCYLVRAFEYNYVTLGKTLMDVTSPALRPTTYTAPANEDYLTDTYDPFMKRLTHGTIVGSSGTLGFPQVPDGNGGTKSGFGILWPQVISEMLPWMFIHNVAHWRMGPFSDAADAGKVTSVKYYTQENTEVINGNTHVKCEGTLIETVTAITVVSSSSYTSIDGTTTGPYIEWTKTKLGDQMATDLTNVARCIKVETSGALAAPAKLDLVSKRTTSDPDWIGLPTTGGNSKTMYGTRVTSGTRNADQNGATSTTFQYAMTTNKHNVARIDPTQGVEYLANTEPLRLTIPNKQGATFIDVESSDMTTLTTTNKDPSFPVCKLQPDCTSNAAEKCVLDFASQSCVSCSSVTLSGTTTTIPTKYLDGYCQCPEGYSAYQTGATQVASYGFELKDLDAASHCTPCEKNYFKSKRGFTQICVECPNGFSSNSLGAEACTACPKDYYLDWSASGAPARTSSSPCTICPNDLQTFGTGTETKNGCVPQAGKYFLNDIASGASTDYTTKDCPVDMECDWRTENEARIGLGKNKAGYMILGSDLAFGTERKMYRCAKMDDCPSVPLVYGQDSCTIERTYGIGCSLCEGDYYYEDSKCVSCETFRLALVLWCLGFFVFLFGAYWFLCPSHGTFCVEQLHLRVLGLKVTNGAGLLVGNFNTLAVISTIDDSFTEAFRDYLRAFGEIFKIARFNLLCIGGSVQDVAVIRVLGLNLLPAILLASVAGIILAFENIPSLKALPLYRRPARAAAIPLIVGIFEMLFVNISANAVNGAFNRIEHPFGGPSSLGIEPSIFSDSPQATYITLISIVGFLLWCVGFAVWLANLLSKGKAQMHQYRQVALSMTGFLARFNDENYYFSLIMLARRFLIGMAPSLSLIGVSESRSRVWVIIIILILAVFVNCWRRPYRFRVHEIIDTGTLLFIIGLLVTALASDRGSLDAACIVLTVIAVPPFFILVAKLQWSYQKARHRAFNDGTEEGRNKFTVKLKEGKDASGSQSMGMVKSMMMGKADKPSYKKSQSVSQMPEMIRMQHYDEPGAHHLITMICRAHAQKKWKLSVKDPETGVELGAEDKAQKVARDVYKEYKAHNMQVPTGPETRKTMTALISEARLADVIYSTLTDDQVDALYQLYKEMEMHSSRVHMAHLVGHALISETAEAQELGFITTNTASQKLGIAGGFTPYEVSPPEKGGTELTEFPSSKDNLNTDAGNLNAAQAQPNLESVTPAAGTTAEESEKPKSTSDKQNSDNGSAPVKIDMDVKERADVTLVREKDFGGDGVDSI